MNASMWVWLLLALLLANAPFVSRRLFGLWRLRRKHIGHELLELAAVYGLLGLLAYVLEARAGSVHAQGPTFYVVTVLMLLVLAFPAFVWRYFWHARHRE